MPKLVHEPIYSFQSLFIRTNKEKVVKAFVFELLMLDYDRRKDFLRPSD